MDSLATPPPPPPEDSAEDWCRGEYTHRCHYCLGVFEHGAGGANGKCDACSAYAYYPYSSFICGKCEANNRRECAWHSQFDPAEFVWLHNGREHRCNFCFALYTDHCYLVLCRHVTPLLSCRKCLVFAERYKQPMVCLWCTGNELKEDWKVRLEKFTAVTGHEDYNWASSSKNAESEALKCAESYQKKRPMAPRIIEFSSHSFHLDDFWPGDMKEPAKIVKRIKHVLAYKHAREDKIVYQVPICVSDALRDALLPYIDGEMPDETPDWDFYRADGHHKWIGEKRDFSHKEHWEVLVWVSNRDIITSL